MSEEGILEKIQSCARKFEQKVKTILQNCVECNLFGVDFSGDKFDDKFDDDKSDDDDKFDGDNDEFSYRRVQRYCGYGPNGRNGGVNFSAMNANRNGGEKKYGSRGDSDDSDSTKSKSNEGDKNEEGKDKNGGKKEGGGFLGLRKRGLFGFGA